MINTEKWIEIVTTGFTPIMWGMICIAGAVIFLIYLFIAWNIIRGVGKMGDIEERRKEMKEYF